MGKEVSDRACQLDLHDLSEFSFDSARCFSSNFEKMTETDRFVVAYSHAPACYPKRIVPAKRDWNEEEPTYDPPSWTHDIVFKNADNLTSGGQWADVEKPSLTILGRRRSFSGGVDCPVSEVSNYDPKRARYLFPGGRTGLTGRGLLGRWGPNHAADPIVTRYHKGKLQVVLVLRNDGSDELAFPGGMVDPGATHTQTLKAEFTQEAAKPGGAVGLSMCCSPPAARRRARGEEQVSRTERLGRSDRIHRHTFSDLRPKDVHLVQVSSKKVNHSWLLTTWAL